MKIELLKEFGFSKDHIHPQYYKKGDILTTPHDIGVEYAAYLTKVGVAKLVKEDPPKEPKQDAPTKDKKSLKGAPENKGK